MELSAVSGKELQDFLDRPSGRAVKPRTANSYRWELKHYLLWLEERGLAGPFDKQELEGYHRKHLPEQSGKGAASFAGTLQLKTHGF